jgi:hypothetical protein
MTQPLPLMDQLRLRLMIRALIRVHGTDLALDMILQSMAQEFPETQRNDMV